MRTFCNQLFVVLVTALACGPAAGNTDQCVPPNENWVAVSKVDANHTVHLEDGRILRVRALVVPPLPRNEKDAAARRAAADASSFLHKLLDGKKVTFSHPQDPDRHNRIAAHIYVMGNEPAWLQQSMLAAGHGRISGEAAPCIDDLRANETKARTAGLGLWAEPAYRVRKAAPPGELFRLENTFQIVEGQVLTRAETKRTVYLNFGKDWRKDFTIAIRNRDIPTIDLDGAKVRVRGWVMLRNGPLIEVRSPGQLKILRKP